MPFDWMAYFTYNITLKKHVAITYWMHKKTSDIQHTQQYYALTSLWREEHPSQRYYKKILVYTSV